MKRERIRARGHPASFAFFFGRVCIHNLDCEYIQFGRGVHIKSNGQANAAENPCGCSACLFEIDGV